MHLYSPPFKQIRKKSTIIAYQLLELDLKNKKNTNEFLWQGESHETTKRHNLPICSRIRIV